MFPFRVGFFFLFRAPKMSSQFQTHSTIRSTDIYSVSLCASTHSDCHFCTMNDGYHEAAGMISWTC